MAPYAPGRLGPAVGGLVAGLLLATFVLVPSAGARAPMETVVQDDRVLLHSHEHAVRTRMFELSHLGVDRIRVTAGWHTLAPNPDSDWRPQVDLSDPRSYPQARWQNLDQVVVEAWRNGIGVMIDIGFWAPRWASSDREGPRRTTAIDPRAYRDFAVAIARRYSGHFRYALVEGGFRPGRPTLTPFIREPLPAVDMFALWNEPNFPAFITPQYRADPSSPKGLRPASPHIYRALVEATYSAVKAVRPDSRVLIGNTSARGPNEPRTGRSPVPPLRFVRELACVDERLRPLRVPECDGFRRVPGDGFAHHPYALEDKPNHAPAAESPDDVPIGRIGAMTGLLGRLADRGRLADGLRDVYITEFGYETSPPSRISPFGEAEQARFLPWSESIAWRNPRVRMWAQFLYFDTPADTAAFEGTSHRPGSEWSSGLRHVDGRPKPAMSAFAAGLHVEHRSGGEYAYGRVRRPGVRIGGLDHRTHERPSGPALARIERRDPGGRWTAVATRGSAGETPAPAFLTDELGSFARLLDRGPRGSEYRLSGFDGSGWRPGWPSWPVDARVARPRLTVAVSPRRPRAGSAVRLRVRVTVRRAGRRSAVPAARVRAGGRTARTDGAGRAVLRVRAPRAGSAVAVTATAEGVRQGRALVRARR